MHDTNKEKLRNELLIARRFAAILQGAMAALIGTTRQTIGAHTRRNTLARGLMAEGSGS